MSNKGADMKDHGSCIQSAPDSLLKQIQFSNHRVTSRNTFTRFQKAFRDNILLSECYNESFNCCSAAQFPVFSWLTSDFRLSSPFSACLLEPLSCTRHGSLPAPCSCHIQSDLLQRTVHSARKKNDRDVDTVPVLPVKYCEIS